MASRRQSLKALAEERGMLGASVTQTWSAGPGYLAAADSGAPYNDRGAECYAPTRRAAEAGLRAALESIPLKRKGRG